MVNTLNTGSGLGSGPDQGHGVVFVGKGADSQCLSPPRCINRYRIF